MMERGESYICYFIRNSCLCNNYGYWFLVSPYCNDIIGLAAAGFSSHLMVKELHLKSSFVCRFLYARKYADNQHRDESTNSQPNTEYLVWLKRKDSAKYYDDSCGTHQSTKRKKNDDNLIHNKPPTGKSLLFWNPI
jgi:hypothetical protein